MDDIRVINDLQQLQFEIDLDGKKAYLEYRWFKSDLVLMHTFVPEKFEGNGIAGILAKVALDYVQSEGLKIMVYCPFVNSCVKGHPEYQELNYKKYTQ